MIFLDKITVLALHKKVIDRIGGSDGLRDDGLLDSALAAPKNRHYYEDASLSTCAAAYAFHLVRNHPFVDGNKRIGAASAELFVALNGEAFTATNDEIVDAFLRLAAGELSRPDLEQWFASKVQAPLA